MPHSRFHKTICLIIESIHYYDERHVGNGPCEFSYSTHVLQFFFFNISVLILYVLYKGMATYVSYQNISLHQVVGVESINIDYVLFFVLNIGCSPVLGHTVCHSLLGATVMQKLPVPSQ